LRGFDGLDEVDDVEPTEWFGEVTEIEGATERTVVKILGDVDEAELVERVCKLDEIEEAEQTIEEFVAEDAFDRSKDAFGGFEKIAELV
jgi:hypothetical protein